MVVVLVIRREDKVLWKALTLNGTRNSTNQATKYGIKSHNVRIEFEAVAESDTVTRQNTVAEHGADAAAHVVVQYDEVVGHNVRNGTDTISAAVNGLNTVTEHGKAAGQQAVIGRDMA
ncbi:unnamed protein product, partial [Gongylonema pulchrum]|uniref:Transposase n=1 Tax=Gongylonema pulchrum TaxID=637853 RepID=A0A183EVJ3_9BILA